MRRRLSAALSAVSLLLSVVGCSAPESSFRPVELTGPARAYIEVADGEATKVIQEWNESAVAANHFRSMGQPQRILTLNDYQRRAEIGCFQEYSRNPRGGPHRPVIVVSYTLTHGIGILGHPSHFSVWVYMDSNQTEVFGGQ